MPKQKPNDREVKEKMLGKAPTGSTGKVFSPNPEKLLSDLEDDNSFIHAFCQNCGTHSELSKDNLKNLSIGLKSYEGMDEINPGDLDPRAQYIHKDRCVNCHNSFSILEARTIPGTN